MIRATRNGAVLAESDDTVVLEGNHYFPLDAADRLYLRDSTTHTRCPWKGLRATTAWSSATTRTGMPPGNTSSPAQLAREIAGRIAFWRGVTVEPAGSSGAEPGARN